MARLVFEKSGRAVWISHLDLMRLFQRAFKRAGLPLKHTQGYNPRPSVSIALPLSVGVSSVCELLDFELEGDLPAMDDIKDRLNAVLVEGVKVRSVYHDGRKIRDLALLKCAVTLEYNNGAGEDTLNAIRQLFTSKTLIVSKKSKNGPQDQDIIPMIRNLDFALEGEKVVCITALICCQNPSMNPMQLPAAIEKYLPEYKPDHAACHRLEIYDAEEKIFR